MLITFEMISENVNISFKVFGRRENNTLIFPDKSVPNTMMRVTFDKDFVEIIRTGSVDMKQIFQAGKQLEGYYKNDMGLEFSISSFATEIVVEENNITIFYEHYLENKWQSSNKLKILF